MFTESAWLICSILHYEWLWHHGGHVAPQLVSDIPFYAVAVSTKLFFISIHANDRVITYPVKHLSSTLVFPLAIANDFLLDISFQVFEIDVSTVMLMFDSK